MALSVVNPNNPKVLGLEPAVKLFREASKRVPAYRQFLAEYQVDPGAVKNIEDFKSIPTMTKDNYFRRFVAEGRMADLLWDGSFDVAASFSLTSGSTGDRFAFPAGKATLEASYKYLESILRQYGLPEQSTLVVNCFTMGLWAAGTFFDHAMKTLHDRGWPVHVLSPGLNREEALNAIKSLAPYFDQIIICAYPTAAVKLINEGYLAGLDWTALKLRFIHGGDAFNEGFRDGLLELVGADPSEFSVTNLYATSELYLMGYETPTSVELRKQMERNPTLGGLLPGNNRQPSLQQYDPVARFFEVESCKLVVTADSAMPYIRYNTGDDGGVWDYDEVAPLGPKAKPEPEATAKMPFVYVFGRGLRTVTIWALNIYPEHIEAALEDPRVRRLVTRNYLAKVDRNDALEEIFQLDVELAPGVEATEAMSQEISKVILSVLKKVNGEYSALVGAEGVSVHPLVNLAVYGDARFVPGAKTKVST